MKKLIAVVLVCLLGGGTGAVAAVMWVARSHTAAAAEPSGPDSTRMEAAHRDSTRAATDSGGAQPPDSLRDDSLHVDLTQADSMRVVTITPDKPGATPITGSRGVPAVPATPATRAALPVAAVPAVASVPALASGGREAPRQPAAGDTARDAGDAEARVRRLGKLFSQMPPKKAAEVLAAMSDVEVTAILASVPDRAAAQILAQLPAAQAAAVAVKSLPPAARMPRP